MDDPLGKLDAATARLEGVAQHLPSIRQGGNQSTVTINAGGIGVWVACTCCAVMLACNLFLIALYVDQQQQIRDMGDYLAAIYAQAPHLKPENKP